MAIAIQNASDQAVCADASQDSDSRHDILGCLRALAATATWCSQFSMNTTLPVDDQHDFAGLCIYRRGKRKYYCKNKANLVYFERLHKHFESRDTSYVRRRRVQQFLLFLTSTTEKDLAKCGLNIELDFPFSFPSGGVRIEPGEGGCPVRMTILPCSLSRPGATESEPGFLVRTDGNAVLGGDHGLNIIEVCAAVRLRDRFRLRDGDSEDVLLEGQ